ncbi:MAG: type II secretion system protein [Pseudomonas sp.]|nr:type II secretion system protein [Pseudomonas sp.]|tara:strand:+ start:19607 stop:20083 length:477 start_codon:yes stop_codon:yes gene_type:complete
MRARAAGLTLIELLATLAIVATLASIVVPVAQVINQRQKESELRIALRQIRSAIDEYKKATDEGHILGKLNTNGYPESLELLVEGVDDAKDPAGKKLYFLRRLPRDPMHSDPALKASETWGKRSYASEPDDPKEGDDVYDVFSLSAHTGLNGVPYAEW